MTLGTRYPAEASERLSIYPGRTCGFAAEISVALPTRGELLIDCEEDRTLRTVLVGMVRERKQ
jgi:hypothetical protein